MKNLFLEMEQEKQRARIRSMLENHEVWERRMADDSRLVAQQTPLNQTKADQDAADTSATPIVVKKDLSTVSVSVLIVVMIVLAITMVFLLIHIAFRRRRRQQWERTFRQRRRRRNRNADSGFWGFLPGNSRRASARRRKMSEERIRRRYETIEGWMISKRVLAYDGFCDKILAMIARSKSKEPSHDGETDLEQETSSNTDPPTVVRDVESTSTSDECPICFETFEPGQIVSFSANSECSHVFHHQCIKEWLLRHTSCPVCRQICMHADFVRGKQHKKELLQRNMHEFLRKHNKRTATTLFCCKNGLLNIPSQVHCSHEDLNELRHRIRSTIVDRATLAVYRQRDGKKPKTTDLDVTVMSAPSTFASGSNSSTVSVHSRESLQSSVPSPTHSTVSGLSVLSAESLGSRIPSPNRSPSVNPMIAFATDDEDENEDDDSLQDTNEGEDQSETARYVADRVSTEARRQVGSRDTRPNRAQFLNQSNDELEYETDEETVLQLLTLQGLDDMSIAESLQIIQALSFNQDDEE